MSFCQLPRGDESWNIGMSEFFKDIQSNPTPVPGLKEARAARAVVEKIYYQTGK